MTPELTRERALAAFIGEARWFGGKGRDFEITGLRDVALADEVTTTVVTLTFADNGETALYQVPIASYDAPEDRLGHAFIGEWDERYHYDAVHDRETMQGWLEAFAAAAPDTAHGAFHRTADHEFDLESHSTLFSGEQSNSSVAFGEDSLMKLFRRVTPGQNPDIEVLEALTRAGSTHVAPLYGYVATDDLHLAMLQKFLRTASDGWDLALASARNLFAEGDLHADEVGGDFAGEAHRLGIAVAEVHQMLAEAFPTQPLDVTETARGMRDRLAAALDVVPALAEQREALAERFDAVEGVGAEGHAPQLAQRVHGDLHLGQTLRTSLGWKLVDFEGEPAKPLGERRLPDSPWRDVAGMLRSFDYAARAVARDLASTEEEASQIAYRSEEWVQRNTSAFLDGYVEQRESPLTGDERALITAYVVDKAVYEAVYETRNRPAWVDIPLAALHRLAHGTTEYATTTTE